ncbi:MAG: hypothetical protein HYU88_13320, partial [Chloroflexi bacterium]|nr:hypothetical protein [Chloroflexota bacterium]
MRFYLALGPERGPTDRGLGSGTPFGPLAPGASSARTVPLTIPATTPVGTYFVLACADDL